MTDGRIKRERKGKRKRVTKREKYGEIGTVRNRKH